MKINSIQITNFQGKPKPSAILSEELKKDIQKLMYNMNHDTIYERSTNGNCFKSHILGAVKINKKAWFFDRRFLCAPTEKDCFFDHTDCSIEFGQSKLDINSQTGEAYIIKKPFWRSLKKMISKGHEYIKNALDNYGNSDIVDKRCIHICGVTEKGAKIITDAQKRVGLM